MKCKTFIISIVTGIILLINGDRINGQSLSNAKPYGDMITPAGLSSSLHFLTSDDFQGRRAGSSNERLAAQYLASCYQWMGIPAIGGNNKNPLENYFQKFSFTYSNRNVQSQNVIAFIEGSDVELKKEAIIIVAHYDHLGQDTSLSGDGVYNGAADDGSGTAALLHIAKSFAEAKKNGNGPKRSVLFLHAGAEEVGVRGSNYYVNYSPVWPLEKTTAVINMDGVGGFDIVRLPGNTNYVYVLKADSTSSHLFEKAKQLNTSLGINLELLYPRNAQNFRSDNQPFELELVPAIYFSTGLTEHYHKVTDEASTIDYVHMSKIVKLVFGLSWDLSNTGVIKATFDRSQYAKSGKYFCIPCGCGKDDVIFEKEGICDACNMVLAPIWAKKR